MEDMSPQRKKVLEAQRILNEYFAQLLKKDPKTREKLEHLPAVQKRARDINYENGGYLSPQLVDRIVIRWFNKEGEYRKN